MNGLESFDLEMPMPHYRMVIGKSFDADASDRAAVTTLAGREIPTEELYTFPGECSNQNLDTYWTRMADSSLRNYAVDAAEGVSFLDSHQHHQRLGYSYGGRFVEENGISRMTADFYTVRGLKLGNLATDDFIRGVETGLIRDLSIGFKVGEGFLYRCGICGRDMMHDWDCEHIPGVTYSVTENPEDEPDSQRRENQIAFAWIENARLSEVSAVFDGATPDAMITKATRELRGGRLQPKVQRMLESAYRIELPRSAKRFPGFESNDDRENEDMSEKGAASGAPDKLLEREVAIEARAVGLDVKDGASVQDVVESFRKEIERLKPLEKEAIEGRSLRKALVDETLAEGVRAFGDKFNAEGKRTMLDSLDVESITEMRASWKEIGDKNFTGGRRSEDDPAAKDKEEKGDDDTDKETDKESDKDTSADETESLDDFDDVGGGV